MYRLLTRVQSREVLRGTFAMFTLVSQCVGKGNRDLSPSSPTQMPCCWGPRIKFPISTSFSPLSLIIQLGPVLKQPPACHPQGARKSDEVWDSCASSGRPKNVRLAKGDNWVTLSRGGRNVVFGGFGQARFANPPICIDAVSLSRKN